MHEPVTHAETPPPRALRCSALQHVPHAFSTRLGGVSPPPFDSLNFGNPGELPPDDRDPPDHIAENFSRLLQAAGAAGRAIAQVHQVHGATVHVITPETPRNQGPDPKADAIVTTDPSLVVAVRTADCLPILLASADGRVVGAVHAGWRGIVAEVIPAALRAMQSLGATDIAAAIGPCITGEVFEVGEEVAAEFDRLFAPPTLVVLRRPEWPKPHIDLKRAAFLQLAATGAASAQVLPSCTVREPHLFFSHRRDKGKTGRMASIIGCASL